MSKRPSTVYPDGVKPQIGDIARSKDVDRGTRAIRIWEACPTCGKERWIKRNTSGVICKSCALRQHSFGKHNRRWNPSRRTVTKSGIRVYMEPNHPYFCMAHRCAQGYAILEHRLIMAESLGRPLKVGEVVHHIDGNNCNNDLRNLLLLPNGAVHSAYTQLQVHSYKLDEEITQLKKRVTQLEAEIVRLEVLVETGTGNPDLAGDNDLRARVETLHYLPSMSGQRESPLPKETLGRSASLERIQAASIRAPLQGEPVGKLIPNSGKPKPENGHGNPEPSIGSEPRACAETLQDVPKNG